MATQLRIYTINQGQLHQFAQEWQEKIRPLRVELGFQIGGAWLLEETNQFAWLLTYDGAESWKSRDVAYYASPKRQEMDPDPARLIARVEEYFAEDIF
jgi:hypothetical protein